MYDAIELLVKSLLATIVAVQVCSERTLLLSAETRDALRC